MNNLKKLVIAAIASSVLSGCATGPTSLEKALAMPTDMNRSISVDELLDQAISQTGGQGYSPNKEYGKGYSESSNKAVNQGYLPPSALANQASSSQSSLSKSAASKSALLLTFMSNRAELTNRHQQKLQRFANTQVTASTSYVQALASPLHINCAPSAEANPYAAASTGMSRCLNVSRFLEKSVPNTEISLKPDLPNNQIQISQ